MENLVTKVQKLVVVALAVLLLVVVVLSTAHLGVLVVEEIWKPPRFLIQVQGLRDIFGFFLLVLGTGVFSSSTLARKSSVSKASASARCFSKGKSAGSVAFKASCTCWRNRARRSSASACSFSRSCRNRSAFACSN